MAKLWIAYTVLSKRLLLEKVNKLFSSEFLMIIFGCVLLDLLMLSTYWCQTWTKFAPTPRLPRMRFSHVIENDVTWIENTLPKKYQEKNVFLMIDVFHII